MTSVASAVTSAGSSITCITLEVPDVSVARGFYDAAFDLGTLMSVRASDTPTTGFRGFTLSLVVSQPSAVDRFIGRALAAGAATLKPPKKSLWGYGGVFRAPDGTIWKVATSANKNHGPSAERVDDVVLLPGVTEVAKSKRFYAERGLVVARSFGRRYVEFAAPESRVKLALHTRRALAKDAGVPPEGAGSHRIAIASENGGFTDPDGFVWERSVPGLAEGSTG
jgi:hypothetical protein